MPKGSKQVLNEWMSEWINDPENRFSSEKYNMTKKEMMISILSDITFSHSYTESYKIT